MTAYINQREPKFYYIDSEYIIMASENSNGAKKKVYVNDFVQDLPERDITLTESDDFVCIKAPSSHSTMSQAERSYLNRQSCSNRRVSFAEKSNLVEPEQPLRKAVNVTKEGIIEAYQKSCQKHATDPIPAVLQQLKEFTFIPFQRLTTFVLADFALTPAAVESLEEIFKRVQFEYIELNECGIHGEVAVSLFDIFEYYDSTERLNITNRGEFGARAAYACSRYLKSNKSLEELILRDVQLDVDQSQFIIRALEGNTTLQSIKLENNSIYPSALRTFAQSLIHNYSLREIYLANNNIGIMDASLLSNLVDYNRCVQVLDLSNNQIHDLGFNHIVLALTSHTYMGCLEVLIVWNNGLTYHSANYVSNLLYHYPFLQTLNLGNNNLSDSFLYTIKDALKENRFLLRLGLQNTRLTNLAAKHLADALRVNEELERIDLRGNRFTKEGLNYISNVLDDNKKLVRIDLNAPQAVQDTEIRDLVELINTKCMLNEHRVRPPVSSLVDSEDESKVTATSNKTSRKISLTCQTLTHPDILRTEVSTSTRSYNSPSFLTESRITTYGKLRSPSPSPIPSPVSSPVPNKYSRFSVVRVPETKSPVPSRFTVTVIEPPKPVKSENSADTISSDTTSPTSSSEHWTFDAIDPKQNDDVTAINFISDRSSDTSINSFNGFSVKPPDLVDNNDSVQSLPNPGIIQENCTVPNDKPMSSLDKLLNLFQAPSHLFARYNSPEGSSTTWKDTFFKQCDNQIKCFPFTNSNSSKSTSTTDLALPPQTEKSDGVHNVLSENLVKQTTNPSALDFTTTQQPRVSSETAVVTPLESNSSSSDYSSDTATCPIASSDVSLIEPIDQITQPCTSESDLTNNNSFWNPNEKIQSLID